MSRKKFSAEPTIALCYVRQSVTRNADDTNSPDRQKANIKAMCDKHGWVAEWYEDVDGHKSGRTIKNRPGWLKLQERLSDPDVTALVANDLARLHRKGWRVGDLLDRLERYEVTLALCAPGREIDTSTPLGRIFVQFTAMFDEYYAEDISQRAKDSITYRKSQGKTVGLPPFGTTRNEAGFLIPIESGAWLLPDGTFAAAQTQANPPDEKAIWKGYYTAAERVLSLYAEGGTGLHKLAYQMQDEGWAFRDRDGDPRPMNEDDIRRIVAAWGVYGGLVTSLRAKDYAGYTQTNPDEIPFKEDRAVFPVPMLREVARVRQGRSVKPLDRGKKKTTQFYPLARITYCAHCEQMAHQHNNPKLRSPLNGVTMNGNARYRHRHGVKCGCDARSVLASTVESDFKRLLDLLSVDEGILSQMAQLAVQVERSTLQNPTADPEKEREEAISLCRRRIQAAIQLFGDGFIDVDEYKDRIEKNEREIAYWDNKTTETAQVAMELSICLEAIETMRRMWNMADNEDRQGMARNLFTHIIYDLDRERIVDFKLKAWAEKFLILRGSFFEPLGENKNVADHSSLQHHMPPTGLEPVFSP